MALSLSNADVASSNLAGVKLTIFLLSRRKKGGIFLGC